MKTSLLKFSVAVIAILSLFRHDPIFSQESMKGENIQSFAMKPIERSNRALLRSDLLKEALTDSIRQFTLKTIPRGIFEENDSILKLRLYDSYPRLMLNYRILGEKEEDGQYKMTVEAYLNTALIYERLKEMGFLQDPSTKPALAVLISYAESSGGIQSESSFWLKNPPSKTVSSTPVDRIEKRLALMGFKTVPRGSILEKLKDSKLSTQRRIIKGDIDTLRSLNLGDIVIIGTVLDELNPVGRHNARFLTFSVSAMNLKDGSRLSDIDKKYNIDAIVSANRQSAPEYSTEDAVAFAADDFTVSLVESFLLKWYQASSKSKTVSLNIKGFNSYGLYKEIKRKLTEEIPAILSVTENIMQKGLYGWKIEINGDIDDVAKKLSRMKLDGKTLEIQRVSSENITAGVK